MDKEKIRDRINILLIDKNVERHQDFILDNIKYLRREVGFEHKNPAHIYNVWDHTLHALKSLNSDDLEANMALLLHDMGKPYCYQEDEITQVRHFWGHPDKSEELAREALTLLGYDENFISRVCYLVKYHDTKIDPDNLDNSMDLIEKRLRIQFADTMAHAPSHRKKRIEYFNEVLDGLIERKAFEKEEDTIK